jgi:hypothetical protein
MKTDELRISASRMPDHFGDQSSQRHLLWPRDLAEIVSTKAQLARELESVIQKAGGGSWLGGGCCISFCTPDPANPSRWEIEFQVLDVDRAVVAVVKRLAELGTPPDTIVVQSGSVRRVHSVYPPGISAGAVIDATEHQSGREPTQRACACCGRPIPSQRLQVAPTAVRCLDCQTQLER